MPEKPEPYIASRSFRLTVPALACTIAFKFSIEAGPLMLGTG